MRNFIFILILILNNVLMMSCEMIDKNDVNNYTELIHSNFQGSTNDVSTFRIEKGLFLNRILKDLVDINIEYPQLYLYPDQDLQNTINKQIFDDIIIENNFMDWVSTRLNAELTYEITFINDDYMCILYGGDVTMMTHIYFRKAITINMKTGQPVSIFDFFTPEELNEIVIEKIRNDEYTIVNELYSKEIFEEYFKDEFIEDIAEYINSENIDSRYHIREDRLILSVNGFPVESILIEFEINNAPWK